MATTKSPHIAVMSAEYHPEIVGGLGTVATALSRTLHAKHGHVTVWSTTSNRKMIRQAGDGPDVFRLPRSPFYYDKKASSYRYEALASRSRKERLSLPELIHVHSLEFAEAALGYKKTYGVPVVYTCHSLIDSEGRLRPRERYRHKLQELLFLKADRIVVPSRWLQEELVRRYPRAARRIVVIPHGVSSVPGKTRPLLHNLLYVGRLLTSKGVSPLIEAIAIVKKQHPDVRLTLVGDGPDYYVKRLRKLAAANGVSSNVRLLGFMSHDRVKRLYRSYGVVIVPSRQESFCMVALEAMASGVPLISTRAGGLREFVNSSNAKIIRASNRDDIASSILHVLAHPHSTAKRADKARKNAKRFSWPSTARRYSALFDGLLPGGVRVKRRERR